MDWEYFDAGHNDALRAAREAESFAERQAARMPAYCPDGSGQLCSGCPLVDHPEDCENYKKFLYESGAHAHTAPTAANLEIAGAYSHREGGY